MSNDMKVSRLRRLVLAGFVALAAAVTPLVVVPSEAQAAPVVGFNAGNIIDDSLFYNGNAMSAGEVQTFLNQKLSSCRIGKAPYMPGALSPSGSGNTIASACLKDYRQTTSSRAADAYCNGYVGQPNETAAQIIAKVGQSCGISQKVLLIMLEKEQSLVSDDWPVTRQYNYAMGMNCPDSGPGNSANCDSASAGFYLQMYLGARQLKYYKANPGFFNYKPFQNNTILWNPNRGCGTSNVYIENWATAALYIYTPYRPNQAALNAGWGTGDSCSSYGNRNFYNFYKSWFGSTQGYTVTGDIANYWNARGGVNSIYGYPVSFSTLRTTMFPKGAWVQSFSGGVITTELNTGRTVGIPYGKVYDSWNLTVGGLFGVLGAPVSEPATYSVSGGGTLQWFQGGLMVSAVAQGTAASVAFGDVYDLYNNDLDGIYGELGYPVSSMAEYEGGELQNFQNGFIARASGQTGLVYSSKTGFFDYYNGVTGGIHGKLGFPTGNISTNANGTRSQEFAKGYLVQSDGGQIIEVSGVLLEVYRQAERSGIPLGVPVGNAVAVPVSGGSLMQQFESGLVISPNNGAKPITVLGPIFQHYDGALGGVSGAYGYPTGNASAYTGSGGGSTLQFFSGGMIFVSDQVQNTVGMLFDSPVFKRYNDVEGGIYGWLGYPVAEEVIADDGTRSQQFQNGAISVAVDGAVTALTGGVFDTYQAAGGAGVLGTQQGKSSYYSVGTGASLSFFSRGLIIEVPSTGERGALVYGDPLYEHYNRIAGGIYGSLGYPTSNVSQATGALTQTFQYGVLRQTPGGGVFAFTAASLEHYLAGGAESGALGEPTSDRYFYNANGGGMVQFFSNGLITSENRTDRTVTLPYGPIYNYYNNVAGGIYGSLGYPISEQVAASGVTTQQFQKGTLTLYGGVVTRS